MPKILITHFDPFGGALENASKKVAHRVAELLQGSFEVVVCELPTEYDRASQVARSCWQQAHQSPGGEVSLVLSLGEARCRVKFETMAHNRDDTPELADNAGVIRQTTPIDPEGPASVSMPFPWNEVLSQLQLTQEEQSIVEVSTDPGAFVCNNTAYRLARFFSSSASTLPHRRTPYTFIHVPNHRCEDANRLHELSASTIQKLIHLGIEHGLLLEIPPILYYPVR
ncbi:MAG: pyrrolidone-carboxylate peptidase [Pseudomonadota bacterium]|jgi:pyroglutamyl-peptidase